MHRNTLFPRELKQQKAPITKKSPSNAIFPEKIKELLLGEKKKLKNIVEEMETEKKSARSAKDRDARLATVHEIESEFNRLIDYAIESLLDSSTDISNTVEYLKLAQACLTHYKPCGEHDELGNSIGLPKLEKVPTCPQLHIELPIGPNKFSLQTLINTLSPPDKKPAVTRNKK